VSARPDLERVVTDWLHDAALTAGSDRVLSAALVRVASVGQQRIPRLPRVSVMNSRANVLVAAAAVVAVAVAVIGLTVLLPRADDAGGPSMSPTPAPSATPRPSPSPAPAFPPAGALAVGVRHAIELEGVSITFTVPTDDWVSNGSFGIDKTAGVGPEGAGLILWTDTPVGVFTDPCTRSAAPDIGTSIVLLADAVANMPGTDLVSAPRDVTVGGRGAREVSIRIREDIACDPTDFYLWHAPVADLARSATAVGSTIRTWIVDLDGTTIWIDSETYAGAGPEPGQQVQQIVDSIEYE
jgi:hypothetical protein